MILTATARLFFSSDGVRCTGSGFVFCWCVWSISEGFMGVLRSLFLLLWSWLTSLAGIDCFHWSGLFILYFSFVLFLLFLLDFLFFLVLLILEMDESFRSERSSGLLVCGECVYYYSPDGPGIFLSFFLSCFSLFLCKMVRERICDGVRYDNIRRMEDGSYIHSTYIQTTLTFKLTDNYAAHNYNVIDKKKAPSSLFSYIILNT